MEARFPASAQARMAALVEDLRGAMREELVASSWLQPERKRRAIDSLDALRVRSATHRSGGAMQMFK